MLSGIFVYHFSKKSRFHRISKNQVILLISKYYGDTYCSRMLRTGRMVIFDRHGNFFTIFMETILRFSKRWPKRLMRQSKPLLALADVILS